MTSRKKLWATLGRLLFFSQKRESERGKERGFLIGERERRRKKKRES
jgi:hypothetical protein